MFKKLLCILGFHYHCWHGLEKGEHQAAIFNGYLWQYSCPWCGDKIVISPSDPFIG